jgi:hypothetical protein
MTRFTVTFISSVVVCVLLVPFLSVQRHAYAEDKLLPTAAIVPPTYTPIPTATAEPLPTATAEPLPTALPEVTAAAGVGTEATILPNATVSGRTSDVTAPIATAVPETSAVVATAIIAAPVVGTSGDTVIVQVQKAPDTVTQSQPVVQPTAIVLPTPAPLQPLTQPISKNPALQTSSGIVNSLHLWGTQPLVMLMLICGFAGFGFLYYGQKN